jgi:hypothetical protein
MTSHVSADHVLIAQTLVTDFLCLDLTNNGGDGLPTIKSTAPQKLIMFCLCRQGYQMFGVTLSFIATRSGLLRWQDHVPRAVGENGQSAP